MIKRSANSRKKLIIILVVILVVLGITLCILHIMKTIENTVEIKRVKNVSQENIEENPISYSIEEILNSYGCKNISYSYEKDSNDRQYCKINLNFKYRLYEGQESKEEYFNKIVYALSSKLFVPFQMIDEKFKIDIYVDKDNNICTINGIEDFYKNNSYVKVNSHEENYRNIGISSSSELNAILSNNWKRSNLKLNSKPVEIEEDYIDYGSFKINYTDININFILFSEDYDGNVFEGIKVGDSFELIKNKLGEPSFEKRNKYIVYNNDKLYIFFYKNEIVVYPSSYNYNNSNYYLEQEIVDYLNGEYKDGKALFVKKIIDENIDFSSELLEDAVKVSSYLRGIDIILYDDGKVEITIYDNYKLNSSLKKLAETNKINLNYEDDSIYLHESERTSNSKN